MPPGATVLRSLTDLLAVFRPCFTAPTSPTFVGLLVGLIAQTRRRTVCGLLTGARRTVSSAMPCSFGFAESARTRERIRALPGTQVIAAAESVSRRPAPPGGARGSTAHSATQGGLICPIWTFDRTTLRALERQAGQS